MATAKHIKVHNTEVQVKYAKQYSGKFLPSYKGLIVRNNIETETEMYKVYGDYACWELLSKEKFYNTWENKEVIIESGIAESQIQVLPGMILYNFSTPTKKMFSTVSQLPEADLDTLSGADSDYESGHKDWRANFQFKYKDSGSLNTLQPYTGMLVQTTKALSDTTDWYTLDDASKSEVYQYRYKKENVVGDKRPSYPGMIVANTCGGNIKDYYEYGEWELLSDTNGVYQYIRIK